MRKIGMSLGLLAALSLVSFPAMAREHGGDGSGDQGMHQAREHHDHASEEGRHHREKARKDGEREHERMRHEDRKERRDMNGGDDEGGDRMRHSETERDD